MRSANNFIFRALLLMTLVLVSSCTSVDCPAGSESVQGQCQPIDTGTAGQGGDGAATGTLSDATQSGNTAGNGSGAAANGGGTSGAGGGDRSGMSSGVAGNMSMNMSGGAATSGGSGSSGGANPNGMCVPEACDNADNDCDGKTDEEVTRPCGPMAQGACVAGTEACVAGTWSGTCEGAVEPAEEVCDPDLVDENCNGSANEGCACATGMTQACGSMMGVCKQGQQTCEGGEWGTACAGEVKGTTETCDGETDEDCDGRVDEQCACTNGQTRTCGVMSGECRPGMNTCAGGKWGTTCEGERGPGTETCDGRDNDCDGSTDENLLNECGGCARLSPAVGASCSAGQGACERSGQYECSGKDATVCNARAGARGTESCNGVDDDCDGIADDGLRNDCGGACTAEIDGTIGEPCTIPSTGGCFAVGKMECSLLRTSLRCVPCTYACVRTDGTSFNTTSPCTAGAEACVPTDTSCRTDVGPGG